MKLTRPGKGKILFQRWETGPLQIFKMGSKTYDFAIHKVTAVALNVTLQNLCCKVRLWGKVRKRTRAFLTNQYKLSRPYFHPSPSGLSFVCPFGRYSCKTPFSPWGNHTWSTYTERWQPLTLDSVISLLQDGLEDPPAQPPSARISTAPARLTDSLVFLCRPPPHPVIYNYPGIFLIKNVFPAH